MSSGGHTGGGSAGERKKKEPSVDLCRIDAGKGELEGERKGVGIRGGLQAGVLGCRGGKEGEVAFDFLRGPSSGG